MPSLGERLKRMWQLCVDIRSSAARQGIFCQLCESEVSYVSHPSADEVVDQCCFCTLSFHKHCIGELAAYAKKSGLPMRPRGEPKKAAKANNHVGSRSSSSKAPAPTLETTVEAEMQVFPEVPKDDIPAELSAAEWTSGLCQLCKLCLR